MIRYRTLRNSDYPEIFRTMDDAFSDYQVKMKTDPESYRRRLDLEGVDFQHSVGAFEGEKLVGATMNAVGYWNGVATVHDAGTGVIPEYRRKGVSTGMFEYIIPHLEKSNFKRYSLEVITDNDAAFNLYQRLGFEVTRKFVIYEAKQEAEKVELDSEIEIKTIENPDWDHLQTFWEFEPSWQNSVDCIKRAKIINFGFVILGAYIDGDLAGYAAVFVDSGKIPQIAVAPQFRRMGIGNVLLNALNSYVTKPLIVTNIDERAVGIIELLKLNGFVRTLSQYEMVRVI
ncbi:MAG: GNAT family N-acetyltransferase [Pyrinomonadaceae bacterium]